MTLIHLIFVILTVLVVVYSDEQGLMWFLGREVTLPERRVRTLHILVSIGLGGILLTGGLMFINQSAYLLQQPTFIVKMVFVLMLTINALLIDSMSAIATEKPYKALSRPEQFRVLASGAVSITGWIGAGVCGLLLG